MRTMGISVRDVSKQYGETVALAKVNLELEDGKIYGLLGNNGAGKTTLLSILTNRIYATSGTVALDGCPVQDNDAALSQMVMMGEQDFYPEDTRVKKAFKLSAQLFENFDHTYALELAGRFGLDMRSKIKALSTGYATIFRDIVALAASARFTFLDEPVLGLDAQHREMLYREIIALYAREQRTIVISTHLIAEVANLIEHTIIIDNGAIIVDEPTEGLLSRMSLVTGPLASVDEVTTGSTVLSRRVIGGMGIVCVEKSHGEESLGAREGASMLPQGVDISSVGLQEYFVALMESRETINSGSVVDGIAEGKADRK